MAINIRIEDLDTFAKNGIYEDDIRNTINAYRKEGISDDEIYNKFQQKLKTFQTKETQAETLEPKEELPQKPSTSEQPVGRNVGYVEGIPTKFAQDYSGGFASRLAGIANIPLARKVLMPLAPDFKDGKQITPKEMIDLSQAPEQYESGKQQYEQTLKGFEEQHPIASMLSGGAGTVASFVGPVGWAGKIGKGVQGAVGASKAIKAASAMKKGAAIGKIAPRVAGEMAAFAAYESAKKGTEGDTFSFEKAASGGLQGLGLGLGFGVAGGIGAEVEEPLTALAEKLIVNPRASKLLAATATTTGEGLAIGAIPSLLEGHIPTVSDLAVGTGFAYGGRGLAEGASRAAMGLRKLEEKIPYSKLREMAKGRKESRQLEAENKSLQRIQDFARIETEEELLQRQNIAKNIENLNKTRENLGMQGQDQA